MNPHDDFDRHDNECAPGELTLIEWLTERADNCARIARLKTFEDIESWREDERYFRAAVDEIVRLQRARIGDSEIIGVHLGEIAALKAEVERLKIENTVLLEGAVKDGEEIERLRGKLVANGWELVGEGSLRFAITRDGGPVTPTEVPFPATLAKWVRVVITDPEEPK